MGSPGELTHVHEAIVVEIEEANIVVADVEPGWREALSSCIRPADHHLSDDEIFTILNGGDDDAAVAELRTAKNVTLPMYCVWKSKYRGLDLEQLRTARRREQWRRHASVAAVVLLAIMTVGGTAFAIGRAVFSTFTPIAAAPSTPSVPSAPAESPRVAEPSAAVVEPPRVTKPTPRVETAPPRSLAVSAAAVADTGYRIQVRAAESDQEGQAIVDALLSKGYPAYLTRALVGSKSVIRVRVGPFDTLAAAEEIATQLRSAGYDGVWIAR